jgi:mono/diheme cytochrome c family protein
MSKCSAWIACGLALAAVSCTEYPAGGPVRLHSDMVDQPSFRPQKDPRPLAEGAIPVEGWEPALTREEAIRTLRNPVPLTTVALEQGRQFFHIYCSVCHGDSARGDGPVAAKMTKPANLLDAKYVQAGDGLFYFTMRSGSGMMPSYYESLSARERWEVVHHIRKLQGKHD